MLRRLLFVGVLSAGVLIALILLNINNPLNFFIDRSANFSFEWFESVKPGAPISSAIQVLGDPVRIEALGADYWRCPECSAYCFACNPPDWLIGYKEAWIYAGPDGLIRQKFINIEP